MYECEQIDQQLNDYYSFASSILNFLQKYFTQFHKALITYSIVLKHLHTKSTNLLIKSNLNHPLTQHLHHAFSSFSQTFNDEYHQLEQRAKFLKTIHLIIEKLQQEINSSRILKQKHKLHKYTYRIIHLNRKKKRQYLYQLIHQIRKHDKLTITWKDNLDNITSQTTNLLWKLFSYSPYKFDIKPVADSLSNSETTIDLPYMENNKQDDKLSLPIELGSGDQLHSKSIKENIPLELISNSNNALIIPLKPKQNKDENRSFYSTDIDETIVENNRWINIVKQNEIQLQPTTITLSILTDQSSNDSENIIQRNKNIMETKSSLHLSDISYTTDYYSQNESD
jgi:hypothetical protein